MAQQLLPSSLPALAFPKSHCKNGPKPAQHSRTHLRGSWGESLVRKSLGSELLAHSEPLSFLEEHR